MINSILDTDLYKLTMAQAVCQLFPKAEVRYAFTNRGMTQFPEEFITKLRHRISKMSGLKLKGHERSFLERTCPFLTPVYLDILQGYQYNPDEVKVSGSFGDLKIDIEGLWYKTIMWEVPLMAMISELFFEMHDDAPFDVVDKILDKKSKDKGEAFVAMGAKFADFGTRRRHSYAVHDMLVHYMKKYASKSFVGTSNVHFANKYSIKPIGTQAHEWFMFMGAKYGYREANHLALKRWSDVYDGDLGIALTDTFTSRAFFDAFNMKYAKLFDGVRHDSGSPVSFANKVIKHYEELGIDPKSKTLVFSDGLNKDLIRAIHYACKDKIRCSYGIGTNLTNDVGVIPLNMVIKMTEAKINNRWVPTIKLSDNPGKHSGKREEIELCQKMLGIGKQ